MLQYVQDWFWREDHWLPQGYKWSDVKNAPMCTLYITPLVAITFLIARYVFEKYIAINFCSYLGIVNIKTKSKNSETQIQKATETCWRCFVYTFLFAYGTYAVFGSTWFWRGKWHTGYLTDQQPLEIHIKWYIILELSFYISLTVSQFTDTKRKDFAQQCVHHITTILLISGSYVCAHFTHGTIIMWLHDASDFWLEAAKLAKYAKKQKTCDALFVVFAITFYVMRWFYFPFWVLNSYITENPSFVGTSKFNFPHCLFYLCFVLITLHYYWGYLIGRMVYKFVATGKVEKDARSDDEDDGTAED